MDVEWAEISYLRGQERVVSVCVFTYYLASAFTPMVTQHKMVKHPTYCQMVDGVSCDCATHIPND